MIDKVEKTIHDLKTLGLNNLEGYMLTHNRFNIYMVSIFGNLNKAQI